MIFRNTEMVSELKKNWASLLDDRLACKILQKVKNCKYLFKNEILYASHVRVYIIYYFQEDE